MSGALTIAVVLTAVFVIGYLLSEWRGEQAERLYRRIEFWRKIGGAVVAILLVGTFVRSGNPILIASAAVLLVFAALYVSVEQPHKELV